MDPSTFSQIGCGVDWFRAIKWIQNAAVVASHKLVRSLGCMFCRRKRVPLPFLRG